MKKKIILIILILMNPLITYFLIDAVISSIFNYGLALSNYIYKSPIFIIVYILQVISNLFAIALVYLNSDKLVRK